MKKIINIGKKNIGKWMKKETKRDKVDEKEILNRKKKNTKP